MEKKQIYVPSLVLGIISIVFACLLAIVGWVCSVVGICLAVANMKKEDLNCLPGLITSIVGIACSMFSSIIGAVIMTNAFMG